ncbi:MAG: DUF4126 domain-containing protein [Bacteroidota bacterium]
MDSAIGVLLGIGLSAACGFRVFLPLLVLSVAALSGAIPLADEFVWIGSLPALIVFGTAMVIEIAAYYIPWVDNLLDTIATPLAVVAGIVASASILTELDPVLRWSLAFIAGGGTAGLIQGSTALLRLKSSALTGGLGNFLVSTVELFGALFLSLLAILVPIVAVTLVLVVLVTAYRLSRRLVFGRQATSSPHS